MDNVCGLDIHKDSVFACILKTNGEKIQTQFGVTTPELDRLRDLLVEAGVSRVAMESTSVYWKPLWRILSMDFHMVLVNPYLIKQLPGRKTDVRDAEWIATLLAKELVRESFVPDETQSALRQYERRLHRLNRQIVHAESQMDNQMQACNIRLSNHVSDIGGKSYRKVVQALIEGETRPEELLKLIHGRTVNRCGSDTLIAALTGFVTGVDRDMLRFYMEECLLYERQREECLKSMPGALQGTERTPGDHTGGERAKRDVRPQRGRSRHGHLPFRLRPCRVGRPQATQPDERRQDQGTEDHAREPFPEDRAGAVRVGRGQVPGDQVRPQV